MVESRIVNSYMDGFFNLSSYLFAVFVYYLKQDIGLGVVVGNAVFVHYTGDDFCVHLLYFPNICSMVLCRKACNFLLGMTICRLYFVSAVMEFYIRMHNNWFIWRWLHAGMSRDSSKFLTKARNRDEIILLTSKLVSGFLMEVAGFFSVSLIM